MDLNGEGLRKNLLTYVKHLTPRYLCPIGNHYIYT